MSNTATTEREDVLAIQTPDPTTALVARLENWRHAVGLLQDYLDAQISTQKSITSGLEKAKKALGDAPKFDFNSEGDAQGVAESFQTIRTKNDALMNKSSEVEQSLKGSVGPQLDTLKGDIEKHMKGLKGSSVKGLKEVEKAKQYTQKCIEHLGHYTSSATGSGKVDAKNDPYILRRVCLNAVEDQIGKENSQTDSVLSSQKNFETLDRHIVQVLQQSTSLIAQIQADWAATFTEGHETIAKTFGSIPENHEWELFTQQNSDILVKEGQEKRQLANITFANNDSKWCKPIQEGIMQRKGKLTKSYNSLYFVLTPSMWLHGFKSDSHVSDPTPEWSMFLPDAQLGPPDQHKAKFVLSGKSKSSGPSLGQKHKYEFKCATYDEMVRWHNALKQNCGSNYSSNESPAVSRPSSAAPESPTSPADVERSTSIGGGKPEPETAPTIGESKLNQAPATPDAAVKDGEEGLKKDVDNLHISSS